ncbi:MAG TPA: substrate-binding domain-containing protein, partial [Kofleriaceae bacterium]
STDFLLPLFALDDCMPTISTDETLDLLRDLRANELDLVLCESEPPDSALNGLEISVLERMKLVAVATPDLPVADDWSNVSLLHYRPSSAFRWDIEEFLEERNLRPSVAAESDDSLFLIEAAARGGYVAFVPTSVARDPIAAGRLRPLATLTPSHGGIHAIYQDGASAELVRRAITTLVDHVRERDDSPR